jgi:hypothetical protein
MIFFFYLFTKKDTALSKLTRIILTILIYKHNTIRRLSNYQLSIINYLCIPCFLIGYKGIIKTQFSTEDLII